MRLLKDYLLKAEEFLREKQVVKPRLEAQLIFSHVLNIPRISLYTNEQLPLENSEVNRLRELLVEKSKGKPTAYLLGKKEFFSLEFEVNEHVLIPRPETEELCEWVIESEHKELPLICDLATGSGCIAAVLASEMNCEKILALDISPQALEVAAKNLAKHCPEVSYELIHSDLFADVSADYHGKLDMIVSNPPYIPTSEFNQLMPAVKDFEPEAALHCENPLAFFKRLFNEAFQFLKSGAPLYVETNPTLIEDQQQLLLAAGFSRAEIKHDLAGKARFLRGYKP